MDFDWFVRNISTSWRYRGSLGDACRRFLFVYSSKLPRFIRPEEWLIGFRYPEPVGVVRLFLRSNGGSDAFIHSEVFEHNYYDLSLRYAPKTVLDLGANIGLTTIYFRFCFPDAALACVEPMPGNLWLLRKNLQLNNVDATVFPGAADAEDGRVLMRVDSMDYGHRVLKSGDGCEDKLLEVPAFSIPTLLDVLGWDRIDLLKIDIEGHEKILLSKNADWINLVGSICIECHDGYNEADLRRLSERFGFLPPEPLPGIWLLRRQGYAEAQTSQFSGS